MEIYGKQNIYTRDNISAFFLNPYTEIIDDEDGVYITRIDRNDSLCFEVNNKQLLMETFDRLRNGIPRQELIDLFSIIFGNAQEYIDYMLKEGILE